MLDDLLDVIDFEERRTGEETQVMRLINGDAVLCMLVWGLGLLYGFKGQVWNLRQSSSSLTIRRLISNCLQVRGFDMIDLEP
jgi:hypothetical protein